MASASPTLRGISIFDGNGLMGSVLFMDMYLETPVHDVMELLSARNTSLLQRMHVNKC